VIAGPNAGAEIGIEKGKSYTIGKDPHSCEIVMQDMSVSRNHARLYINEDGTMEIEDLGSKNGTVVNGVAILERQVFTPQDLIALGTTLFMVADREAPQDTIYAPQIRNYEQAKETLETPSGEEIAANVEEELEQPKKHWKLEPIPFKHLVIAGSSMVMFLIVFLSFFSLFKPESLGPLPKEPVSHIQDALAKFKDVHYSFNPGTGRLFLVGHVSTPIEYQEMNYKLSQIDFITAVEDTVIIDEGVCRTMNDVITANSNWRGVSISSPEPGKFVAAGYLQTIAEANSLAEYLTVNFPYLDRLDNKVVVEQVLDAQLQGMLNAQSLGAVAYQLNNGEVVLTGRYSDKLKDKYHSFIKEIQATSGVVGVRDYAVATHEDMASVDVSQNYQVGGTALFDGEGYTVVLNGKIYALGEKVDGMKIASIHTDTILLEKDGLKYRINF
jgi:type III secretion system YscD/HrpQ family protein